MRTLLVLCTLVVLGVAHAAGTGVLQPKDPNADIEDNNDVALQDSLEQTYEAAAQVVSNAIQTEAQDDALIEKVAIVQSRHTTRKHKKKVPQPTVFAVVSEMVRVHEPEPAADGAASGAGEQSNWKCGPDGSVSIEGVECPAQRCPPCRAGFYRKSPPPPPRSIRIVQYAPDSYPFGKPQLVAEEKLTVKRARQVRSVLSGMVQKREAEREAAMKDPHSDYNMAKKEGEAAHLEELEKLKEKVKWNHMSGDEKIEKSLLKVLDALGIEATEPVLTPSVETVPAW